MSMKRRFRQRLQNDIVNIGLHFFLKDVRPMQHPVMNHRVIFPIRIRASKEDMYPIRRKRSRNSHYNLFRDLFYDI